MQRNPNERLVRFSQNIIRFRAGSFVCIFLISCVSAYFTASLKFESSIRSWFLDGDTELALYDNFISLFEADEITVIGVFSNNVFNKDVLGRITKISQQAEEVDYVNRVRSLANTDAFWDDHGELVIAPLLNTLPVTDEEVRLIRKRAIENRMIQGNYISADGRAAAIVVEMSPEGNTTDRKIAFVKSLNEIIEKERTPGVRIVMAGSPAFDAAFAEYSAADAGTFGVAAVLVAFSAIFIAFRNIALSLTPIIIIVTALLWAAGLMSALGLHVNILTAGLVSVVLTVGVADSIHMLTAYRQQLSAGYTKSAAIVESIVELAWPCLLTFATTAAGLLSLSTSDLQPIREFGWIAAAGVFFAFLLTFVLLPPLLELLPEPAYRRENAKPGPMARLLQRLGTPGPRRSKIVLSASALLVLASAFLFPYMTVGANPLNYFKTDAPIRLATELIDHELGGSTSVEFLVKAPDEGLYDPQRLRRLEEFQTSLMEQEGVTKVTSIVDMLKEMRRVFEGLPAGSGDIPETSEESAQLHFLLSGSHDYTKLVQNFASEARITARVTYTKARELIEFLPQLETQLATHFSGPDLSVHATGQVRLFANMHADLLASQISSNLTSFIVIGVLMFLIAGSVRLGMLTMIPNLVPVIVGLGIMTLLHIDLDPGTVMIGSIALGLVVDDTVHFMVCLRRKLNAGHPLPDAIERTIMQAGDPIILTSIVLSGGFLVMALSSFTPNIYFGLISALVTLLALVSELVILPSALLMLRASK